MHPPPPRGSAEPAPWVLFQQDAGERHEVALVRPTAPTAPLRSTTCGGNQTNPDWSPDGSAVRLRHERRRARRPLGRRRRRGDARLLLDCRGRCRWLDDPDWSPDGKRIVYSRTISAPTAGGSARSRPSTSRPVGYASCSVRGSATSRPARGTRPTAAGSSSRRFTRPGAARTPTSTAVTLSVVRLDAPGAPGPRAHRPAAVRRHGRLEPGREAHRLLRARRAGRRGAGPLLDPSQGRRTDAHHVPGRRRRLRRGARLAAGRQRSAVQRPARQDRAARAAHRARRRQRARLPFGDDAIYGRHPRVQPMP